MRKIILTIMFILFSTNAFAFGVKYEVRQNSSINISVNSGSSFPYTISIATAINVGLLPQDAVDYLNAGVHTLSFNSAMECEDNKSLVLSGSNFSVTFGNTVIILNLGNFLNNPNYDCKMYEDKHDSNKKSFFKRNKKLIIGAVIIGTIIYAKKKK